MALTTCDECGASIAERARTCPKCGVSRPMQVGCLGAIATIFITLAVIAFGIVAFMWLADSVAQKSRPRPVPVRITN